MRNRHSGNLPNLSRATWAETAKQPLSATDANRCHRLPTFLRLIALGGWQAAGGVMVINLLVAPVDRGPPQMCRRRYGAASDLDQRLSTESLQGAAIEPFPFTNI